MCALLATAEQPHSSNIFLNKKILPLDKLINQEEGILAYKVINGMYLLINILTDRHELDHYQLRNDENQHPTGLNATQSIIYFL